MKGKIEKINISLVGVLNVVVFLAFFFAKIFDKIDWSWWWIFSPLWIPVSILVGAIGIFALIYFMIVILDLIINKK